MTSLPRTYNCFVCGRDNPKGLRLTMQTDGEEVLARFIPKREHTGFRDTVHGGLLSTLLDEVMAWICGIKTGQFAYCAELKVRFHLPTLPESEILFTGKLSANQRNRIFKTAAEARDADGKLLASAEGKYLPMKNEESEQILEDFVEDPSKILSHYCHKTG